MQRIQGATATIDNKFTEGNPSTNTPATIVSSNFMNSAQEEIAQSVERGLIGLDLAQENQLGDFITEYSRPFNLLLGFGLNCGAGPVTTFTPAIHNDYLATGWIYSNGLGEGSPNAVSANVYVNSTAGNIECEGTATAGDYFLIKNVDGTLFDVGQNYMSNSTFTQKGSETPLPNATVTKSSICLVYGGGVPVELSLIATDGIIFNQAQNVNNGETKQAVIIQKNASNYGNFDVKVKLLQTGNFKVALGGFCALWGANKKPPYTLESPFGAKFAQAQRNYQIGKQGKQYVPAILTSGPGGASNQSSGFCFFNAEMASIPVVSITGLSASTGLSAGPSLIPAPSPSIVIGTVYKNGFEYTVYSNLTTACDFIELSFNWKAWKV